LAKQKDCNRIEFVCFRGRGQIRYNVITDRVYPDLPGLWSQTKLLEMIRREEQSFGSCSHFGKVATLHSSNMLIGIL